MRYAIAREWDILAQISTLAHAAVHAGRAHWRPTSLLAGRPRSSSWTPSAARRSSPPWARHTALRAALTTCAPAVWCVRRDAGRLGLSSARTCGRLARAAGRAAASVGRSVGRAGGRAVGVGAHRSGRVWVGVGRAVGVGRISRCRCWPVLRFDRMGGGALRCILCAPDHASVEGWRDFHASRCRVLASNAGIGRTCQQPTDAVSLTVASSDLRRNPAVGTFHASAEVRATTGATFGCRSLTHHIGAILWRTTAAAPSPSTTGRTTPWPSCPTAGEAASLRRVRIFLLGLVELVWRSCLVEWSRSSPGGIRLRHNNTLRGQV